MLVGQMIWKKVF